MTINIEWQDQHGNWHHYQTKQNQADAYRVAKRRAESTGKRHRLVDGERMSELMLKNGIGVSTKQTFVIHKWARIFSGIRELVC